MMGAILQPDSLDTPPWAVGILQLAVATARELNLLYEADPSVSQYWTKEPLCPSDVEPYQPILWED
jgi:hypothetical protein